MQVVGSADARAIAGLSHNRLREWTGRRGLVEPDIPASGKGTQARFSWRTLLMLRLAKSLQDDLGVELFAHKQNLRSIQKALQGETVRALWDKAAVLSLTHGASLVQETDLMALSQHATIVIALQPHLREIVTDLGAAEPTMQLPLFPVSSIR
ncbi:hypothetical protein ACO34A_01585 [Rhizobium sp. ACO-34A]|nr:hypothetical protein [Rhizobium sp. ACO-34A]ATN32501.1 hypothetical protein ACO34A_01585 [Rhizobium sp. ACO-34A]